MRSWCGALYYGKARPSEISSGFQRQSRRTWESRLSSSSSVKPWKGLGGDVYELVEDHRGNTYRAVYTVRIENCVHVLHAFQKKSKSGIKTPRVEVNLIEQRLKAVLERHRDSRK
jgi:phage-related protein